MFLHKLELNAPQVSAKTISGDKAAGDAFVENYSGGQAGLKMT